MKIKALSSINAKEIETGASKAHLFKPYEMDCRLYITEESFIEFEYLKNDECMSLDDFYHECGHVMPAFIINNEKVLEKLEKAFLFLMLNEIVHAEPVIYADNTPVAVLTRAALKNNPHANKNEFKHLIIDKAFDLGFRKGVIDEAIKLYK